MIAYVRDGAEIYRRSFAIIRAEADLAGFDPVLERAVVRMIHACGMVDLAGDVDASPGFAGAATAALQAGAPVLCDTRMVASGVTRSRLPAGNDVVCTLGDPRVPALAAELDTTRTAAALAKTEAPAALRAIAQHGLRQEAVLRNTRSRLRHRTDSFPIPPPSQAYLPRGEVRAARKSRGQIFERLSWSSPPLSQTEKAPHSRSSCYRLPPNAYRLLCTARR